MDIFGWLTRPLVKRRLLNRLREKVRNGVPERFKEIEIEGKKFLIIKMRPGFRELIKSEPRSALNGAT